jgi:hypothetical protein
MADVSERPAVTAIKYSTYHGVPETQNRRILKWQKKDIS